MTAQPETLLEATGVSKHYGGTQALSDMTLTLRRGEIHALVGGNGSGKSTFIKILAGVECGDSGEVRAGDMSVQARHTNPDVSWSMGLRFVHQRTSVFPDLSIGENLAIGSVFPTGAGGRIRWREQHRRARALLDRFGIDADPRALASTLSPAKQTLLAIARALQNDETGRCAALVLDEPTASLPKSEVEKLLASLRQYAEQGEAILYVSHRLDEILTIADRVSVLRDGRHVGTYDRTELTHDRLVELISGRSWSSLTAGSRSTAVPAARTESLRVTDVRGGAVRGATFAVAAGEVVGVAGLLGSGRSTLLRLLFGDLPRESGSVQLGGTEVSLHSPSDAMRQGIGFVPEDRLREAAFADLSIQDNVSVANLRRHWRRGLLRRGSERAAAAELMRDLNVKASSPAAILSELSGGNQQKVMLARWMQRSPRLLLLDEPTQGVDVGARSDIHGMVRGLASRGAACLVVSSDPEELELLCDRILVMRSGRVVETSEPIQRELQEQK
jgi:ribose transport system ATP-binding protein